MSPQYVVRLVAVAAAVMALAVGVYHVLARTPFELRHVAFIALQLAFATALLRRIPVARWIAAVVWSLQGGGILIYACFRPAAIGPAPMLSITFGVFCVGCTALLLSPVAGEYFHSRARAMARRSCPRGIL